MTKMKREKTFIWNLVIMMTKLKKSRKAKKKIQCSASTKLIRRKFPEPEKLEAIPEPNENESDDEDEKIEEIGL